MTDPLGYVTKYGYDADGNKTSKPRRPAMSPATAYDNDSNLTALPTRSAT